MTKLKSKRGLTLSSQLGQLKTGQNYRVICVAPTTLQSYGIEQNILESKIIFQHIAGEIYVQCHYSMRATRSKFAFILFPISDILPVTSTQQVPISSYCTSICVFIALAVNILDKRGILRCFCIKAVTNSRTTTVLTEREHTVQRMKFTFCLNLTLILS